MVNPSLAPRNRRCIVCNSVSDLADVNLRLLDASGNRLGIKEAAEYMRQFPGWHEVKPATLAGRLFQHRKHVERYLRSHDTAAVAPAQMGTVTRIGEREDASWLSIQQAAMNVGRDALGLIASRLETFEPKEQIAVARLGVSTAAKRADLEIKGHVRRSAGRMRIASGVQGE